MLLHTLQPHVCRLERERQQKDQANILPPLQNGTKEDTEIVMKTYHEQEKQKENAIPEILPKAVPGTPLPGKKNWVVGKFGRVLPVVYLRRRDMKKIAKFDPSKTTHCLKKIKPEEPNITVSELTWNLESENEIASGTPGKLLQIKGKKQQKSKLKDVHFTKADFDVNNGLEKYEKKASADTLKGNLVPFPSASHSKELSADVNGDLESDSSASHSESDADHYHRYAKLKRNTLNNTEGNSPNTFDRSTSIMPRSHDVLPVSTSSKKNSVSVELDTTPQKKTNVLSKRSEVEGASCTKIQSENNSLDSSLSSHNIGTVQPEDDKHLSDKNNSTASDRVSFHSSVETSDIESSGSEIVIKTSTDQLPPEVDTKFGEISPDPTGDSSKGLPLRSPKTNDESKISDNPHKREHSNEKRLDALQEKKKSVLAQRNLIKDALKDLDSGTQSHDGKKHIVFPDNNDDDDESGGEVMEKTDNSIGDKVGIYNKCVL